MILQVEQWRKCMMMRINEIPDVQDAVVEHLANRINHAFSAGSFPMIYSFQDAVVEHLVNRINPAPERDFS